MVKSILRWFVRMFNIIIPKNKKHIYLRSSFEYRDNIHALLDYIIENVSPNTELVLFCDGNGFENYEGIKYIVKIKSKASGLYHYFRSGIVIFDNPLFFTPKAIPTQVTVNIWHGVSLKRIMFYEQTSIKRYRTSTYVTAYSQLFAEKMAYAFDVPLDNVLITGEPRNDYLFTPASDETMLALNLTNIGAQKRVIWMPTYRRNKYSDTVDGREYQMGFPLLNEMNIDAINTLCQDTNILLILKQHGMQPEQLQKVKEYSNIRVLSNEILRERNLPLYTIIARCDALITDYSSISFNFMVLDRPICFAYDDIEEYEEKRGFMFSNIREMMPGYHANNLGELTEFLKDTASGVDRYAKTRREMSLLINKYCDNRNAERLINELKILEDN